nr:MAG TPA: hypothetical protein [Caudoviricetes sp.]
METYTSFIIFGFSFKIILFGLICFFIFNGLKLFMPAPKS